MSMVFCKQCHRNLWRCQCERFDPDIEIKIHWPPKYKIVKGIQQVPEKDRKYRIVLKDGQYATEAIET